MTSTVAIDALSMGNPPQGIGAYSLNLVRALRSDPQDLQFIVFVPAGAPGFFRKLEGPSIRLFPCSFPEGRFGRIWYQNAVLPGKIKQSGAGLLHSVGNLLPAGFRGASILTVHDIDFAVHPGHSPVARRMYFKARTASSLNRANIIVTDSGYSAGTILDHYPRISAEKVIVNPLGGPRADEVVQTEKSEVPRRYGIEGDYFISVGTLELRKNVSLIIKSFETYREKTGRPASLLLVGHPGYGYGRISRLLAASPRRGDIIEAGYVPPGYLPALYAGATALLMLSEAEGFGLPALEGMAHGCPVIAACAGALPETCGDAAVMVPPGNETEAASAMDAVASGRLSREALIHKGRLNLARFSWAEHARIMIETYRAQFERQTQPRRI